MEDFFDNDLSGRDLPNVRQYDLGNNKINIERHNPFGFWKLKLERGQLPEKYRGWYTSVDDARKAVLDYLHEKGKETKPINA